MNLNGNNWVVKWLLGALWGALTLVVLFIGNTVKANDNKSTEQHTAIRKEIAVGDEKVFCKVEKKMEEFRREQIALKIQTAKILEVVKYLKEKSE